MDSRLLTAGMTESTECWRIDSRGLRIERRKSDYKVHKEKKWIPGQAGNDRRDHTQKARLPPPIRSRAGSIRSGLRPPAFRNDSPGSL